jgi:PKD repeat protein
MAGCSYPPVANFTASDTAILQYQTVTFTNNSSANAEGWIWFFEGGSPETYPGPNPPPIQYISMGAFDVTLTAYNIAGYNTLIKHDYIEVGPSGISQMNDQEWMKIYPNPSTGKFTVQFRENVHATLLILDQPGNTVFQKEITEKKSMINASNLPPGFYFIRVTDLITGKTSTDKLIIQ